ncbi:MAG: glycolate oxidase subunit GlcE [Panacagrimonas sp.]
MALEGSLEQFRARILAGKPLRIRGGGTKDFYGERTEGEVLDMRAYRGVIAHDPAELVITARCGTPLVEIESLLAEHRQTLPFEPPHFGEGATIGGCIAAGLAGPRRMNAGAPRDFVLGAVVMDARGEVLHFGGQVMKNVAGYDVARLMAGSLGILGVILEVSIKLLPRPPAEATLAFETDQATAIRQLNEWAGQPLPISASAWHRGKLHLRLSGATAAVDKACRTLSGSPVGSQDALEFWTDLREQRLAFFAGREPGQTLWRFALPSTAPVLALDEDTLIEWGGLQRWVCSTRSAGQMRDLARKAGGHVVAFRRADERVPVFDRPGEPLLAIHRRLKNAFDPQRVFNRGRMFPDL